MRFKKNQSANKICLKYIKFFLSITIMKKSWKIVNFPAGDSVVIPFKIQYKTRFSIKFFFFISLNLNNLYWFNI